MSNPTHYSIDFNGDTLKIIIGINTAIQTYDARLILLDKYVICVALDGTCTFDDRDVTEIKLTNGQLFELAAQALVAGERARAERNEEVGG